MKVEWLIRGIFFSLAIWALWEGVTTYHNDARGMITSGIVAAIFATIASAGICKPEVKGDENG